jgi:hypothetical protein
MRGPNPRSWTPFEITLIQTFRAPLVRFPSLALLEWMLTELKLIGELFTPAGCTLVQDKWRTFFRNDDPGEIPGLVPPRLRKLQEDYFDLLSQMPYIAHRGYELLLAVTAGQPIDPVAAADLIGKTTVAYSGWQEWIATLFALTPPPEEIPSPRGDPLFPTVYKYDDPWRATGYIVSLGCVLIANMVFMSTGYGGDRSAEVKDVLEKICKSVETVGEGACGPYRVSFGLRAGFEAATPEIKEWIKGWLIEYQVRFQAAALEFYPKVTVADMLSSS